MSMVPFYRASEEDTGNQSNLHGEIRMKLSPLLRSYDLFRILNLRGSGLSGIQSKQLADLKGTKLEGINMA